MTDKTPVWTPTEITQSEKEFFEAYGRAIAQWADFEYGLAHLFALVTDMHDRVAVRVFFSARTSQARLDMINGALPAQIANASTLHAIKALTKKAGQYNETRNRLAHELTTIRTKDDGETIEHVLANTKKLHHLETRLEQLETAITVKNLKEIFTNFSLLTLHTVSLVTSIGSPERHEEYRDSILSMPNPPYTPDQPTRA
jgi:hypothetical protein